MRYTLTILVSTIVTILNGQSLGKIGNKNSIPYDTIEFHSFPKLGDNHFDAFEYGSTTIDYYTVTDLSGDLIIQNSYRTNEPYTHPTGKQFACAIFWARIINKTATPFELTINSPADSFAILPSPDAYLKIFLPPDTMTLGKAMLYNHGITDIKSFLDNNWNEPSILQKTISPKEEFLFYIAVLTYHGSGVTQAELVLKERDLFFRLRGTASQLDSVLIPAGHIIYKK